MVSPSDTANSRGTHRPINDHIAGLVEQCITRTATALYKAQAVGRDEIMNAVNAARTNTSTRHTTDLIELVARAQGHAEEYIGAALAELAAGVATSLTVQPPLIPFAGKLMTPSAFYESYPELFDCARYLHCPVLYAEDTDAIGVGALNPIAAEIMAKEIQDVVSQRCGIRPFVSTIRLTYETSAFLIRKHFHS